MVHQERAAYIRAAKAAAVAAKIEEIKRQRMAREARANGQGDDASDGESCVAEESGSSSDDGGESGDGQGM